MKNYYKGRLAEFVARFYMNLHGYRIIAKNYVTGRGSLAGEVDFIACRKKTIVFVEVKQRKTLDDSAYAISNVQKQRIIRGAQSFLKKFPYYQKYDIRFDAVLIALPFKLRHIKQAWDCNK